MDKDYGHSCHIARMNPNHPFLRQGQMIYYQPDESAYNSDSAQNDSDPFNSSKSSHKYDDNVLTEQNEDSVSESHTNFNESFKYDDNVITEHNEDNVSESHTNNTKFFKIDTSEEESLPTRMTTSAKLNDIIHILDGNDESNKVILESRPSPTCFQFQNHEIDDTVRFLTPKPIKSLIIEEADEKGKPRPRMDWNNYHTLDVIHDFLDDLEYDYPSICTAGSIGQSIEGRELKVVKISNSDTRNACVWIDAGIHAREWIAPAVATYIANHISTNFNTLPNSITNKDWYILPVVNPDGYEYSHTVDRMWRKNRAWHSGECVGVDLNRNFSCGWGGKGSSNMPSNAFYRGPEPFSEPESTAVRDMLKNVGISFKVYITLHSYGQVIVFPFAYTEDLCPDYVRLLEGATVMSKAIQEASGNTYKVGISRDVMYGAAGTSTDWSYGEAGIPFCYLIELRSRKHKFKLPQEEIQETGNEILNCVKALMEFVDAYPIDQLKK